MPPQSYWEKFWSAGQNHARAFWIILSYEFIFPESLNCGQGTSGATTFHRVDLCIGPPLISGVSGETNEQ